MKNQVTFSHFSFSSCFARGYVLSSASGAYEKVNINGSELRVSLDIALMTFF
jgi:hypothetical protein